MGFKVKGIGKDLTVSVITGSEFAINAHTRNLNFTPDSQQSIKSVIGMISLSCIYGTNNLISDVFVLYVLFEKKMTRDIYFSE